MAYTALEKMRRINEKRFGRDVGPMQPGLFDGAEDGFDLKSAALRFLHERCEDLRFDRLIEAEEARTGRFHGTSAGPNQIPYNMQMDIDRLCLERELERFIDSGATQDAYTVYYCFLEMFLGNCSKSKEIMEILSEYETNGSSLLMKHRDHFSHSVYVFTLGLAIYETNENFRRAFNAFYAFDRDGKNREQDHAAAHFFLEFWGLTSLFHDIGYPFELCFEQVISYFEADDEARGVKTPYIIYRNTSAMTELGPQARERFWQLFGRSFDSLDEVLAFNVAGKLGAAYGFSEEDMREILRKKAVSPESFCYYMDHAYFSAMRLYRELIEAMGIDVPGSAAHPEALKKAHIDALSAIALHYDLFSYSIAFTAERDGPGLSMNLHPLAWLLMLCDELQCWDRTAYGRNSRSELHPMGVEFDFRGNRLIARYLYDEEEQEKIDAYLWAYATWKRAGKPGKAPKLKAYSDMAGEKKKFLRDIERLVDTAGIPLTIVCDTAPVNRGSKHVYLSNSSFLHLHDFAVALNARYAHEGEEDEVNMEAIESEFAALSLEYKLANIHQVCSFSRYLNTIHCFYTDRPVDFDMVTEFSPNEIRRIAPMEHARWVREHAAMGWRNDDVYEREPTPGSVEEKEWRRMLREQTRCHMRCMDGEPSDAQIIRHFRELTDEEKALDSLPLNSMLKLIKRYDGLRIYRYADALDQKDEAAERE